MPGMHRRRSTAPSGQAEDGTNNTTCHSFVTQSRSVKYVLELQPQKLIGIVRDSLQHLPYEAERGWIYLVYFARRGANEAG